MIARRVIQSMLLLGLCAYVFWLIGALYLVGAVIAGAVAISSGMLFAWALAVGLVWPVIVLAFVAHRLSGGASASKASESLRAPCSDR